LRRSIQKWRSKMKSFLSKTFGGLSGPYYLRHFLFGLMFPVLTYFTLRDNLYPLPFRGYVLIVANGFLYPYARFVYEGIIDFVIGDNIFFIGAWPMLLVKFLTMYACWLLAPFIAPVAFIYLYVFHTRSSRLD